MRIQPLIAALIAVPALAAVVGPYWLGERAELAYRTTLAEIQGQPQVMQVIHEDYRRGWFSSKASLELVPGTADQGTDLRLRVDSDVAHGPRSLGGADLAPGPGGDPQPPGTGAPGLSPGGGGHRYPTGLGWRRGVAAQAPGHGVARHRRGPRAAQRRGDGNGAL